MAEAIRAERSFESAETAGSRSVRSHVISDVAPEQAIEEEMLEEDRTNSETLGQEDENLLLQQLLDEIRDDDLGDKPTDTYEAEYYEDLAGSWWPSSDQLEEMKIPPGASFFVPKPADWKDVVGSVHLCIDRARKEGWEQTKREIEVIRGNVKKIPGVVAAMDQGLSLEESLFNYLLGPTSEQGRVIMKATGINDVAYKRFLFSFMLSCQTNQSIPALHNNQDVSKEILLPTKEYNRIWCLISKAGEVRAAGANREDPLWKQIERIFNEQARQLFMSDDPDFRYVIAVDDDKVHFEWKCYSNTKGLKRCRHTKANARGFVVHTAGFPGSGAVIQVGWAQESDTDTSVYQRIVGGLFGSVEGGNNRPKIMNVEFHSDRGYWAIELLFDYMLPTGAAIGGTVKRNGWIPFTYDKKKAANAADGQEVLSLNAYKNAYFKQVDVVMPTGQKRTLQLVAYRSGTGTSMSLVLSTKSLGKIWDMLTVNPTDYRWYHNNSSTELERNKQAFERIKPTAAAGFSDDDMEAFVRSICTHVEPRTCGQNTADWFLERMFALTSSQIAAIIRITAPLVGPSHHLRSDFEVVLQFADLDGLLPGDDPIEEEEEELEEIAIERDGDDPDIPVGHDPNDLAFPEDVSDDEAAQFLVNHAKKWPRECPNVEAFGSMIVSINVLKKMLELVGCKPLKSDNSNRKKIMDWVRAEPWERPFVHLTKPELTKHPLFKRAKANVPGNAKIDEVRAALAEVQRALLRGEIPANDDNDGPDEGKLDPVLVCLLQKSFLKKEAAQDKNDARLIGQMNEPELLIKLWKHSQQATDWQLPLSLKAIVHPGLVRQRERPFLKSSADAVVVYEEMQRPINHDDSDNESENEGWQQQHMPVEVKTLVEMTRVDRFKELLLSNVGFNTYQEGKAYFRKVDSSSAKEWLPNKDWLFQALHQAVTFKTQQSLLVVGTERRVLLGLLIDYQPRLIESFLAIIDWIYEKWLCLFYNPAGLDEEGKESIKECLRSKKLKRAAVDYHSFETSFSLWFRLNVDVQSDIRFPLPKCSRIIPYANADWNCKKIPSDTTTKNIDSCDEKIGVRTPQTLAVARMMQLKQHQLFRALQMLTAKENLDHFYHSVRHYRDAASHRMTFQGSFEQSKGLLRAQLQVSNQPTCQPTTAGTPSNRPKRGIVHTIKKVGHVFRNGITPGRQKQTLEQQALASQRNQECLGLSLLAMADVKNVDTGKFKALKRQHCALCGVCTSMYCTGCNRYFCINKDRMETLAERGHITADEAKKKTIKLPILNRLTGQTKSKWFLRSCYQIAHEKQWEKHWEAIAVAEEELYCMPTTLFAAVDNETG